MRWISLLAVLLLFAACSSDPVQPDPDPVDPEAWFDGAWDGEELVLQRSEFFGPGGVLVTVELVARDLDFDASSNQLSAQVSIRNASRTDLYAPASVAVSNFNPPTVHPLNANNYETDDLRWWYDYSRTLGDDRVLSAGETSGPVEWILQLPGPGSFSFEAVARFAGEPDRPQIGGRIFVDRNRDGLPSPDEPAGIGSVVVTYPDGRRQFVLAGEDGWWLAPVARAGLYTARWSPDPALPIAPVCLTTPNPLQVMITPGPDGGPTGFMQAHFGIDPEPCFQPRRLPILISDVPVDSLESDPWDLVEVTRPGPDEPYPDRLDLAIAFSGCSANHPLSFVFGRPDDSAVPQTTMVATIVHDDLGELCDAYFVVRRALDLGQLRAMWLDLTGYSGTLAIELHTPQGIERLVVD